MSALDDILSNDYKGKLPEELLQAYLEGRLDPAQQHELEAWLAEEGMESDAVEGLKALPPQETKQLVDRLNYNLHHELGKKKRRRKAIADNQWAWVAILIVLMLCVLGFVVVKMVNKKASNQVGAVADTAQNVNQVIADSTSENLIKFEPKYDFRDFTVDQVYSGKAAALNMGSNKLARRYKTRITDVYNQEGVNFAGHYCFVYWGCGSPCKMSAIVDLRTGKIYTGPDGTLTYTFRKDSRMVLLNDPERSDNNRPKGYYNPDIGYEIPEIWVWNEVLKEFEQK
jgi:hypothetical protein